MNLTHKTITAGGWVIGHKFVARFSGLIKTIILARILTPNEFGIFGLTTVALGFLETLSETSVEQALIQKKNLTNQDLSSTFIINLIRGVTLCALLFLLAPVISRFFDNPIIIPYLQIIALSPLIKSLKNPRIILLQKKLNFKREFILRTTGTIAEVAVGIVVSLLTHNAWGLVASILAGVLGETIISYFIISPLKRIQPTKAAVSELLKFSRWLWGSSILSYISTQGDNVVVGKLLGATPLGFYQNAYKIATLPSTQITAVANEVTYPALSQISSDHPRFVRAFKKTFLLTAVTTITTSVLIILFAKPLTLIIFGPQWLPLVPSLRILSLFGAIKAVSSTVGPLLKAAGHPQVITIYTAFFVAVMLATILPFTLKWGIIGTSWSIVLASLITQPYLIIQSLYVLSQKTNHRSPSARLS